MIDDARIVAVGLLTQRDLDMLGSGFQRAFPLDHSTDFDELLKRIDQAELKQAGGRTGTGKA